MSELIPAAPGYYLLTLYDDSFRRRELNRENLDLMTVGIIAWIMDFSESPAAPAWPVTPQGIWGGHKSKEAMHLIIEPSGRVLHGRAIYEDMPDAVSCLLKSYVDV